MGVSENGGIPKSSILIGISIVNHPFWGYHYFWKHPYVSPVEGILFFKDPKQLVMQACCCCCCSWFGP